jgi:hypothetical protein
MCTVFGAFYESLIAIFTLSARAANAAPLNQMMTVTHAQLPLLRRITMATIAAVLRTLPLMRGWHAVPYAWPRHREAGGGPVDSLLFPFRWPGGRPCRTSTGWRGA